MNFKLILTIAMAGMAVLFIIQNVTWERIRGIRSFPTEKGTPLYRRAGKR